MRHRSLLAAAVIGAIASSIPAAPAERIDLRGYTPNQRFTKPPRVNKAKKKAKRKAAQRSKRVQRSKP